MTRDDLKIITVTRDGVEGELALCSCHRTHFPVNLLDAEARCLWSADHDPATEGHFAKPVETAVIETAEDIPMSLFAENAEDERQVLARRAAFLRNHGERAPMAARGLLHKLGGNGRTAETYRTDLPTQTLNCEEWCQHCGGRPAQTPSVGIVMLVLPDFRLRRGGGLEAKGNKIRFQPVCQAHLDAAPELPA